MALADYHARSAAAASQVIAGFDEDLFRHTLSGTSLEIAYSSLAASSPEGRALLDLLVRLSARLYPALRVTPASGGEKLAHELTALARQINPAIEADADQPSVTVAVGLDVPAAARTVIYAGSDGWDGLVSTEQPCPVGTTENPFGAGVAACLAMANAFRVVFLGADAQLDASLTLSVLDRAADPSPDQPSIHQVDLGELVLVGAGAIGNAALWALARSGATGRLHIVDHELVELSNLQRYVLASCDDVDAVKVELGARHLVGALPPVPHRRTWAGFVGAEGYEWPRVLVALDSAAHRRAVQAALPKWIANAWTQPGDLGLSIHPALDAGACLACLYLPAEAVPSEDALIAQALHLPDRMMQIRELLYRGADTPRELLESAAQALDVPLDRLLPFEGKPLRTLYVEGICGGALIPFDRVGGPPQEMHVPLAHQSALAGVLLAAAPVAAALGRDLAATSVTRIDVMRPLGRYLTLPAQKDIGGRCICQDDDYLAVYRAKYPPARALRAVRD
jgi:Prokaryotic E2 family C/ThiF family